MCEIHNYGINPSFSFLHNFCPSSSDLCLPLHRSPSDPAALCTAVTQRSASSQILTACFIPTEHIIQHLLIEFPAWLTLFWIGKMVVSYHGLQHGIEPSTFRECYGSKTELTEEQNWEKKTPRQIRLLLQRHAERHGSVSKQNSSVTDIPELQFGQDHRFLLTCTNLGQIKDQ